MRYPVRILDGADQIFSFSGAKIPKFSATNASKCTQLTAESVYNESQKKVSGNFVIYHNVRATLRD